MRAVLRNDRGGVTSSIAAALTAVLVFALPARLSAHDIPGDITIQAFVKPEGHRLRLLVRVPLHAMRDMELPLYGPGYLNLARSDSELRHAAMLWIGHEAALYEDGRRLATPELVAVRASIPTDRAFSSYDDALAHVTGPRLPDSTQLVWQQALLDALFEYPIQSDRSQFSINPGLDRLALRVVTVLRFLPPGGAVRAFEYTGDPSLIVLDPRWHQAALRFVALGFSHILDGLDHLLFLLCVVIPFRRLRPLVALVTAFTVGHSITLIASAAGLAPDMLWFPPLVETLIAVSIVYTALENIVGANLRRRWMVTFGFGLVHGFGFSFALRDTLQFGGAHMLTALLSFNVGVELGQLLVLAFLVPALEGLYRFVVKERVGTIILSALVTHTGWHWMTGRAAVLRQYEFRWPSVDAALLGSATGWLMLILVGSGLSWWVGSKVRQRRSWKHSSGGVSSSPLPPGGTG
ncbi:MAG: HupE/UreJ family protein [Candidatus Latescibacteria bacterium]|nr:HupE/UreJ family protein [Candidatus Latescibacterota bacterium]